jgi:hypothetical protein
MDLADYLDQVCHDKTLGLWLQKNIPVLYATRNTAVSVVVNGRCLVYSPLPVMELFARYEPERARQMWMDFFDRHVAPCGLQTKGHIESVNTSEYEAILDTGLFAWQKGVLSDKDFRDGTEKILLILGSPRCARTIENWMLDAPPERNKDWAWEATPYAGYMNDVRAEGFYDGVAQAFYAFAGQASTNVGSQAMLYQFTSPGAHHTERIRFGQMSTFNLLDTHTAKPPENLSGNDTIKWEFDYVAPPCPAGSPCLGVVDVTALYFKNESCYAPTGHEISGVNRAGQKVLFDVYFRFGMDKYFCYGLDGCDVDKVTLAFLIPDAHPGEKGKITVSFSKKTNTIGK